MKTLLLRSAFTILLCIPFASKAQNDVDLFLNDMLRIADDFATPAAEGAAYLSGAGWFTSASSLGLWEVEVSAYANFLFIPEKKKSTSISSRNYDTFNIRGSETAEIPTAFGNVSDVVFEGQILGEDFEFDAIDGVNKSILAHPFFAGFCWSALPYRSDFTFSTPDGGR